MITTYINYPNAHITIHGNPSCGNIRQHKKAEQRTVLLNTESLSKVLSGFRNDDYRFAAEASLNDMWLDIDFGDVTFEAAVVEHVRSILAAKYKPFSRIVVDSHCAA